MNTIPEPLIDVDGGDESERRWYVHKFEIAQQYGGAEEGGWWFDSGVPVDDWTVLSFTDEDRAYEVVRALNDEEHERREREEDYGYTSVLSYRSCHYEYRVEDEPVPVPFPACRPHYE